MYLCVQSGKESPPWKIPLHPPLQAYDIWHNETLNCVSKTNARNWITPLWTAPMSLQIIAFICVYIVFAEYYNLVWSELIVTVKVTLKLEWVEMYVENCEYVMGIKNNVAYSSSTTVWSFIYQVLCGVIIC